jgi:hypothetical protein
MDQFLTTLYAQLFADSDELENDLGKTNAFPAEGSYVDVHKQKVKEVGSNAGSRGQKSLSNLS